MSYATHDLINKIHFSSNNKNRHGSILNLEVPRKLAMSATAAATDLSLHISPPSPPDAWSSGGGGGEAYHETAEGFFAKPKLCLGFETTTATAQQDGHQCDTTQQQRLHQPSQIQRFKKSSPAASLAGGTARSGNGGGGKRSSRAPRMRWTTALHAHFVHAVELLGGHESTFENVPAVSSSCGAAASTLIT
jgi:hypothetical protein